MVFAPENPLESALERAPQDPLAQIEFYRLLMASRLYVLGDAGGRTGDVSWLPEGSKFTLRPVMRGNDKFFAIFSSKNRLMRFAGDANHFYAGGRSLFENTMGERFVLNPGSECGKELHPTEIAYWLNPPALRTLRTDKPMDALLGQPAVYPAQLVQALKVLFANRSEILTAVLAQFTIAGSGEPPHPLIGVETLGDFAKISGEIALIGAISMTGTMIDAVPLDRNRANDPFNQHLLSLTPFYQRTTHV